MKHLFQRVLLTLSLVDVTLSDSSLISNMKNGTYPIGNDIIRTPHSVFVSHSSSYNCDHRVSHDRLIRVCHIDYDRDIALVVLDQGSSTGKVVAAARLTKEHGRNIAEFSMLVADQYQG